MKRLINGEFPQKKNVSIAIETAVWVNVTREFVYRAHIYCVFADILNEEQRKIHDLQITIDAVSKSIDDRNKDYYCGPDKPNESSKEDKKEVTDINLPFIAGWDPEMKKRIKQIPKGWQLITV